MEKYKSYQMYFCYEYTGQLNKLGGLPTHLPPTWPKDASGEDDLIFLCQLYCDGIKLEIENVLCIQIYQWVDSNGEERGGPVIVSVPIGVGENLNKEGIHHPMLPEGDIQFEEVFTEVCK